MKMVGEPLGLMHTTSYRGIDPQHVSTLPLPSVSTIVPGTHLGILRWPTVFVSFVHLRVRISEMGVLGRAPYIAA